MPVRLIEVFARFRNVLGAIEVGVCSLDSPALRSASAVGGVRPLPSALCWANEVGVGTLSFASNSCKLMSSLNMSLFFPSMFKKLWTNSKNI